MRTLKKVLALSLVFAMAFTMMAGAAFKDQNKIDSSLNNDIQLLTALGVFKGDENGNFNPTANVKRSEAAKMIYVLKNNGVDDGAVAFQGVSKYADVPVGHWAEGYINYCTNLGYMGGWKEGNVQKFDPNGNVTGVELTKMLLCMIGYKADIQGYTGNGWQTNVLVDAATSGLSANFIPSIYGATPRQWTARLMTNALDAEWVTYSKGELTYKGNTYAEQFLGLRTAEGILAETNSNKLGNSMNASLNDSDKVRVTLYVADASGNYPTITAVGDADDSLLGQPVKMYYKLPGTTSEAKLYAVLPYAKNHKVVNTTIDAIKYDSADTNNKTVTIEGLGKMNYAASGATNQVTLYVNNVKVSGPAGIETLKGQISGNDSRAVTVVANKDGYAETILVHEMTAFAKVKKIDASKNTLTLEKASTASFLDNSALKDASGAKLTFDNSSANKDNFNKYLNVASDVKEGSIVKITANTSTGKLVYDITLADKVEGTPTGYTVDGNNYATLTINGETVKLAGSGNVLATYDWKTATNTSLLSDKTFYTDGKYVVFSEGGVASASVENLAYITGVNKTEAWGKTTYAVKALLADGTVGEYELAKYYKDATDEEKDAAQLAALFDPAQAKEVSGAVKNTSALEKVYTYSISDGKITLKALVNGDGITFADGQQTYKYNKKIVSVGGTEYKVADNAYFFVKSTVNSKDSYSVVKAADLKKDQPSTASAKYAHKDVGGIPTFLFGTLNLTSSVIASGADYSFVNSEARWDLVDGKHVVSMNVVAPNGDKVTIKKTADNQTSAKTAVDDWNALRGKVVTYTMDAKGNVESITKVTASTDDTLEADKWNKMEIEGWTDTVANVKKGGNSTAQLLKVASDVKIHYVDASKATAELTSGSTVEKTVTDGQMSAYAYVQNVNGINTITDIFVEVNGGDLGSKIW